MMQQTKKKMVLEHLVVHKMNTAADLKQVPLLCNSQHHQIHCLCNSRLFAVLVDAIGAGTPLGHSHSCLVTSASSGHSGAAL